MIEETKPVHTIEALCERSHQISREKGWVTDVDPRPYHTVMLLNQSEISEVLEDWRDNKRIDEIYYEVKIKGSDGSVSTGIVSRDSTAAVRQDAKPCGIPIEIADLVIRICQRIGTADQGRGEVVPYVVKRFEESYKTGMTPGLSEEESGFPFLGDVERSLAMMSLSVALSFQDEMMGNLNYYEMLGVTLAIAFALCEHHKIDLWAAIDEKEAYNRTRPIRHGGKKC